MAGAESKGAGVAGLVSLGGFMSFWGWIFALTTAVIFLFKHEAGDRRPRIANAADGATPSRASPNGDDADALRQRGEEDAGWERARDEDWGNMSEEEMGVAEAYLAMRRVARLPAVRMLVVVLMTCKLAFAAADSVVC